MVEEHSSSGLPAGLDHPVRGRARGRLLEAALALFAEDGAITVTMEQVRAAAGVSVGATYHHFADKPALLDALQSELFGDLKRLLLREMRSHSEAESAIRGVIGAQLRWAEDETAAASVLFGTEPDRFAIAEAVGEYQREVEAWWDIHARYGTVRRIPYAVIDALWLGPAREYCRQWLSDPERESPRSVTGPLGDAAWRTLRVGP